MFGVTLSGAELLGGVQSVASLIERNDRVAPAIALDIEQIVVFASRKILVSRVITFLRFPSEHIANQLPATALHAPHVGFSLLVVFKKPYFALLLPF